MKNRPLTFSLTAFALLLAAYGLFELYLNHQDKIQPDQHELISHGLSQAGDLYNSIHQDLISETSSAALQVRGMLETGQNRQLINRELSSYRFWGAMLYRENEPWTWDGFNLVAIPAFFEQPDETVKTSIIKRNNVVLLAAQTSFQINEESYRLLTAKKLEQTTNLPFGGSATFNLSEDPSLRNLYPVNFNFFNPLPDDSIEHLVLSTTESDSAAVVYASYNDAEAYELIHSQRTSQWRMIIHLTLFSFLVIVFIFYSAYHKNPLHIFVQILTIAAAWISIIQFGLAEKWVAANMVTVEEPTVHDAILLAEYSINGLFLALLSLVSINALKDIVNPGGRKLQLKGTMLAFIFGGGTVFLFLFFIISTSELLLLTSIPLLDLELVPGTDTFLFYLAALIFFSAIGGIAISVSRFLFRFEEDKSILIFIATAFGFISVAFVTAQFLARSIFTGEAYLLSAILLLFFTVIGWGMTSYPQFFRNMSGFRKLMIGLFTASLCLYSIIWSATSDRLDRDLLEVAADYTEEGGGNEDQILRSMLIAIEQRLQFLSEDDFISSPGLVQVQFQRAIQTHLRGDWHDYQFDIQLVRPDGEQVADYSTNLDSPGWTALFNTEIMFASYRGERLRRETNRPVIQGRPSSVPEDYRSFYRGWIPIYNNEAPTEIIAWIFGAIYQERPDFNKPLRAMMAAATGDDWRRSYYLAEFVNNRVTRSAIKGIYTNQPEYNRLSEIEASIAMQDSIAHITTITSEGVFRELLLKTGDNTIIKASSPKPRFNNHLFSFFRLHIVITLFGLFLFSLLSTLKFSSFNLFGQSKRFQERLIDGLTLATLLFLTVLIFATQYAVGSQTEKNLERELVTKLKNLGESVRTNMTVQGTAINVPLAELASPLNVDAILYRNVWVTESTTPQIFQQHLIPRIMPFTVYEFLYNRERRHVVSTVQLGDETLLIGYRAILDDNNEPIGAVAIPTFLQSPVYTEQLLETTSYLFAIYLAIFFLFIIGSVILSNQLTKPLQLIQQGLTKITRGERRTKIPVSTQDEIGSLANAYNEMVQRLDEAQRELIKAERESAWKEMAQQVAHEIKNPLTPMKLNLQHLQRQLEENPENVIKLKPAIEKTAANIIEQIESLNKIASDFSKFAKPIHEPFEPVDLKELTESVAQLYDNKENVIIETSFHSANLTAECVADEIRRVLINLVKNGVEATEQKPCRISIDLSRNKDRIIIKIRDYGTGIPEIDYDQIFVPNFSTKSSGTGLGLAITKKIIEAHNGEISFNSKLNLGTEFTVELPINQ